MHTNMQILVVDDEPAIRLLLKHIFKTLRPDYRVSTAIDGPEALIELQQQLFNLVIIDYQLPGMNGLELAYNVYKRWPRTGIVLISGHPPPDIRRHLKQLGLTHYLKKPFSPMQLLEVVDDVLGYC
ncbi:MAG: response regulator [Anaerolineae bacterium]|nr:response regulator [Anaerolineae bacterium]